MNYNKILKKWIDRKIIEMCWFELQDRDVKSVVQTAVVQTGIQLSEKQKTPGQKDDI